MRAFTILVAALLAAGALSGCIGNAAEKDPETESIDPATIGTDLTSGTTGTSTPPLKVLAPLVSSLKLDGPAWIAPGASVPVEATAPTNAKGTVAYTWAVGALPGTAEVTAAKPDTKNLEAGSSKVLTFATAGVYRLHCNPHAAIMNHNVTVVDGIAPTEVQVDIVDGDKPSEYRFVPENLMVGTGSKVNYVNKGALMHTASTVAVEPPLKKVALDKASGDIMLEGNGWQRIVVLMRDTEGRFGSAEDKIYVAPLPSFAGHEMKFDFKVGGVPEQGETAEPPQTSSFVLEHSLKANVSMSATIAPGGTALPAGGDNAQVEVHIFRQGETQDSVTCGAGSSCEQAATLPAGTYTIKVIAKQGAAITGTVSLIGTYEAVPPAPAMGAPAAEGEDPHAGH